MTLSVGRVRLRVHPLMLLFPLAAAMLGLREDAAALLFALIVHEGAHLLAARMLRVGVRQLRLMPFGGAIQLEDLYALSSAQLLAIAAAGPLGSLGALTVAAALAHWGAISAFAALAMLKANLLLLAFNLLPALPLDGGRMLYALLFPRIGRARAADLGILLGRITAAALLGLCAWTGIVRGRFNLSFALCAAFMLASGAEERRALGDLRAKTLLNAMKPPVDPVPARLVAVGGDCPAQAALRAADPGAPTLYAVYRDNAFAGFTDDRRLLDAALAQPGAARVAEAQII